MNVKLCTACSVAQDSGYSDRAGTRRVDDDGTRTRPLLPAVHVRVSRGARGIHAYLHNALHGHHLRGGPRERARVRVLRLQLYAHADGIYWRTCTGSALALALTLVVAGASVHLHGSTPRCRSIRPPMHASIWIAHSVRRGPVRTRAHEPLAHHCC